MTDVDRPVPVLARGSAIDPPTFRMLGADGAPGCEGDACAVPGAGAWDPPSSPRVLPDPPAVAGKVEPARA